jgi:hypothetical protein
MNKLSNERGVVFNIPEEEKSVIDRYVKRLNRKKKHVNFRLEELLTKVPPLEDVNSP